MQPSAWLAAFLTREADTVRHMGPRAIARLVAFGSYQLPAADRVRVLSGMATLGLPVLTTLALWGDISGLQFGSRRMAA